MLDEKKIDLKSCASQFRIGAFSPSNPMIDGYPNTPIAQPLIQILVSLFLNVFEFFALLSCLTKKKNKYDTIWFVRAWSWISMV